MSSVSSGDTLLAASSEAPASSRRLLTVLMEVTWFSLTAQKIQLM